MFLDAYGKWLMKVERILSRSYPNEYRIVKQKVDFEALARYQETEMAEELFFYYQDHASAKYAAKSLIERYTDRQFFIK